MFRRILNSMSGKSLVVAALLTIYCTESYAAELFRRVTFLVKPETSVRGDEIRLKDIASFGPAEKEFQDLVETLKEIRLADAPAPRTKSTILGVNILRAIELAGLPKDSIGYSVPRIVTVEREGRLVTRQEVLTELKNVVWKTKNADIQIHDVEWANQQVVPTGESRIQVEVLGEPVSGKFPVRAEVFVNENPEARFLATAIADDWREVPVLNRGIERGALISPEDIQVVRLNLAQQPADTVSLASSVYGMRAKARLNAGEVVRRGSVDVPPMIPKGKRVTIVYDRGLLRATATGIALEDGFEGSKLSIRNESSKKILAAKVLNGDEVEAQ